MRFVFGKCAPPRRVAKATGGEAKSAALQRLRDFLDAEEPQTVEWLVSARNKQQSALTYKELREAILSGGVSPAQVEQWRLDYSRLVTEKLAPQWERAMLAAAAELHERFPHFLYDSAIGAAQAFIQQRGAFFVGHIANEQREALRAILVQGVYIDGMTADELSRMMRPVVGLNARQATANARYYQAVKTGLLNAGMGGGVAERRAREAAARYADRRTGTGR